MWINKVGSCRCDGESLEGIEKMRCRLYGMIDALSLQFLFPKMDFVMHLLIGCDSVLKTHVINECDALNELLRLFLHTDGVNNTKILYCF